MAARIRQSDQHLARIVGRARREELRPLVHYLSTGLLRSTPNEEDVRNADAFFDATDERELRRHIVAEIQQAGGSTLGNLARGLTGVAYGELLHDVMQEIGGWNPVHWETRAERDAVHDTLKCDFDQVERPVLLQAERKLFLAMLDRSLAKAEPQERERILAAIPGTTEEENSEMLRLDHESLARILGRRMGSMLTYQVGLVIAGQVARNVAGQGIRLILGGALGRYLAVWAGPVGVGVSAVLTFHDLTGPAMRKILPCVLHLALLDMEQQITPVVGVLGSMSAGKDTIIHALFGIDTGGIDVLPGSTTVARVFDYQDDSGKIRIVNAPGAGDPRDEVEGEARSAIDLLDAALLLINAVGGVAGATEKAVYDALVARGVKVIPVLHKVDLCRTAEDMDKLQASVAGALGVPTETVLAVAAAPDPRIRERPLGLAELHRRLRATLDTAKETTLPRGARVDASEG